MISCNGNRGSFAAVEKHLVDFKEKKIKPGTLKKMSYRINKNWSKYEQRLLPVIEIVQAVREKARH